MLRNGMLTVLMHANGYKMKWLLVWGDTYSLILFVNTWIYLCSFSQLARQSAYCDYGLYIGASNQNFTTAPNLASQAVALKMYLNETFTTLRLDDICVWIKVDTWKITSFTSVYCTYFFYQWFFIGLKKVILKFEC